MALTFEGYCRHFYFDDNSPDVSTTKKAAVDASDPNVTAEVLAFLAQHGDRTVQARVVKNKRTPEALLLLANSRYDTVRRLVADRFSKEGGSDALRDAVAAFERDQELRSQREERAKQAHAAARAAREAEAARKVEAAEEREAAVARNEQERARLEAPWKDAEDRSTSRWAAILFIAATALMGLYTWLNGYWHSGN